MSDEHWLVALEKILVPNSSRRDTLRAAALIAGGLLGGLSGGLVGAAPNDCRGFREECATFGSKQDRDFCNTKCKRCNRKGTSFCIHRPDAEHPDRHATCCAKGEQCCLDKCCPAGSCCLSGTGTVCCSAGQSCVDGRCVCADSADGVRRRSARRGAAGDPGCDDPDCPPGSKPCRMRDGTDRCIQEAEVCCDGYYCNPGHACCGWYCGPNNECSA